MEFHYKIIVKGNLIPFDIAVKKKYIILSSNGFQGNVGVQIYESSGLIDVNNNEIYENDVLKSENGKRYIIEKLSGTFFFREVDNNKGCIPLALSGIKFGNKIDCMQIE